MQYLKDIVNMLNAIARKKRKPDEIGNVEALALALPFFNAFQVDTPTTISTLIRTNLKNELFPPFPENSELEKILFTSTADFDRNSLIREYFFLLDELIVAISPNTILKKYQRSEEWMRTARSSLFLDDPESKIKIARILLFVVGSVNDIGPLSNLALLNFDLDWFSVKYDGIEAATGSIEESALRVRDASGELSLSLVKKYVTEFATFSNKTIFPEAFIRSLVFPSETHLHFIDRGTILRSALQMAEGSTLTKVEADLVRNLLVLNAEEFNPSEYFGNFNTLYVAALRRVFTFDDVEKIKVGVRFEAATDLLRNYESNPDFLALHEEGEKLYTLGLDLFIEPANPFVGEEEDIRKKWVPALRSSSIYVAAKEKVKKRRLPDLLLETLSGQTSDQIRENLEKNIDESERANIFVAVIKAETTAQFDGRIDSFRLPSRDEAKIGIVHVRMRSRRLRQPIAVGIDVYVCPNNDVEKKVVMQYVFGTSPLDDVQRSNFSKFAEELNADSRMMHAQEAEGGKILEEFTYFPFVLYGSLLGYSFEKMQGFTQLLQRDNSYADYVAHVFTANFL